MKKISYLILICAVALSFAAGYWLSGHPTKGTDEGGRKVLYYVDPMNPGFKSDKPGIAPCGMPLEPVYAGSEPSGSAAAIPGTVNISPARQQLIGVRIAAAEKKPLTRNVRLFGRVTVDEKRVYRLNTAVESWVREISNADTGSVVDRDEILALLLAPAFFNAQQTYLITLDTMDRIVQQGGEKPRSNQAARSSNQLRSAIQGLQTLGISEAQVEELRRTRTPRPYMEVRAPARGVVLARNVTLNQWFRAGEELYRIADLSRVWVLADTYEQEANYIKPGMKVTVNHSQLKKTFGGTVGKVLPQIDPVTRTLKVRVEVDNPGYDLRPDMFVDVEIPVSLPAAITVPVDAVVDSGLKKVVYVDKGNGYFEPRRVETGWRYGNNVEVTGGLMPGEKVVVSGVFLIDSESRMRLAASGVRCRFGAGPCLPHVCR